MTPERFEQLADAWGADLRRWPAQEQAAAHALMEQPAFAPAARAVLARANELDTLLGSHAVAPPSAALASAVLAGLQARPGLATAPGQPLPHAWPQPRGTAPARPVRASGRKPWHGWWSGASIAGAGLAGVAAGALAVALLIGTALPTARPAQSEGGWWPGTAFDTGGALVEGSEE